jgi:hypothetical protein
MFPIDEEYINNPMKLAKPGVGVLIKNRIHIA